MKLPTMMLEKAQLFFVVVLVIFVDEKFHVCVSQLEIKKL